MDNFNTYVGVLRVKRPEIFWGFFFVSLLFTLLLSRSTHCNGRWAKRGKTAGGCPARLKVWWSHTQSYRKLWNGFKLKWDRKTARLIYFGGISECCLKDVKYAFILHKSIPKENTLYCYYHHFGGHLEIKSWQNNNKTVQEITQACKRAKIQSSPSKTPILALR